MVVRAKSIQVLNEVKDIEDTKRSLDNSPSLLGMARQHR